MPQVVYRVNDLLCRLVAGVPVGTNLALVTLLWMMLSGRLLRSRGAVIPALADSHLSDARVRRCWAALAKGRWNAQRLLDAFWREVQAEGQWHPSVVAGYRLLVGDLVGFHRPRLKGCPTKHFCSATGQSVPAIRLGLLGPVGRVGEKRVLIPRVLVRAPVGAPDVPAHRAALLKEAAGGLQADELLVADREFTVTEMQAARIERYVVRARRSFTARRSEPPAYQGTGRRPTRGERVRPLPRQRNGRTVPATPPDRQETWTLMTPDGPLSLRACFWDNLVLTDAEAGAPVFHAVVVWDPRYEQPLEVVSPLRLSGKDAQAIYAERWPGEQVPLTGKQLLGAARQFVFAPESCQRLPELALTAGGVANYVAATQPPSPTGFWDRRPKSTAGRMRRVLAGVDLATLPSLPEQVREKASATGHLLTGVAAHRRLRGEHLRPHKERQGLQQALQAGP